MHTEHSEYEETKYDDAKWISKKSNSSVSSNLSKGDSGTDSSSDEHKDFDLDLSQEEMLMKNVWEEQSEKEQVSTGNVEESIEDHELNEESCEYSHSQLDVNIIQSFSDDFSSDFESFRLTKKDSLSQGISKLRDSYLEASKDVLHLLKVLDMPDLNKNKIVENEEEDDEELDLSYSINKSPLKNFDDNLPKIIEVEEMSKDTSKHCDYQVTGCNPIITTSLPPQAPVKQIPKPKIFTEDWIYKLQQIIEDIKGVNQDLANINIDYPSLNSTPKSEKNSYTPKIERRQERCYTSTNTVVQTPQPEKWVIRIIYRYHEYDVQHFEYARPELSNTDQKWYSNSQGFRHINLAQEIMSPGTSPFHQRSNSEIEIQSQSKKSVRKTSKKRRISRSKSKTKPQVTSVPAPPQNYENVDPNLQQKAPGNMFLGSEYQQNIWSFK